MSKKKLNNSTCERDFFKYLVIFTVVVVSMILLISLVRKNTKSINANTPACFDKFYEETIFDDVKIKLNSDIFSHEQVINEVKEKDLIDYLNKNLKKGDTIVYVSMDIGVQQLLMAKLVSQSGKVYVFNPIEKYSDAIALSAKINGFENRIITNSHAISDGNFAGLIVYKNGTLEAEGSLKSSNYQLQNGYSAISVEVNSLDVLCQNLQNINFLRISFTENLSNILKGAEQLLLRSPKIQIIADYDSSKTKDFSGLENLQQQGFSVYLLKNGNLEKIENLHKISVPQGVLIIKK
ncbi:MAG: hypothetical protein E7015_03760 [Alphaproteobacteria bacterium]|nr:hypothetical protein [Alphaproteobacteria bacterium]